jgi:hypothetical protein
VLSVQTHTASYWTSDFQLTQADLDFIYNLFLEEETPLKTPDLIQRLITFRIEAEFKQLGKYQATGEFYQPKNAYELGQQLIIPLFDFSPAKVIAKRPGENPDYGPFNVITVELEDGRQRDLASELGIEHKLNQDLNQVFNIERPSAEAIYKRYRRQLTRSVVDTLREDKDMLFIAKRWFLKSLLLEVNLGHLNLAEAALDMTNGGPLETRAIAEMFGFGGGDNPILQTVSLDYALSQDPRFDEVGPAGQVLWFLRRMEPKEISSLPHYLSYLEIPYEPRHIREEMKELAAAIDDELSEHEIEDEEDLEEEGLVTLIYPHLRSGTLPLTDRIEHLFPIAYRTPRIRITLIDGQTQEEMQGWVVREHGYVYGLKDFYTRYELPIGAYVTVRPTDDDPGRIVVNIRRHKPRSEWIPVAKPYKDRFHLEQGQVSISVEFDPLMVMSLGEDLTAMDKAWDKNMKSTNILPAAIDIIEDLMRLSQQEYVHGRTMYSAINMLRRCPPEPLFALLGRDSAFIHAGGPYWRARYFDK